MTIGCLLKSMAKRRADHPFSLFEDEKISFGELNQPSNRVANTLWEWGVRPGDTAGIGSPATRAPLELLTSRNMQTTQTMFLMEFSSFSV